MKRLIGLIIMVFAVLFISVGAEATIINPNPATLGNDNGTELFLHGTSALSVEIFDLFGTLLPTGSRFGFYFASSPSTLITVFDGFDQTPTQSALINFNLGRVTDVDAGALQSLFTPQAGPIGFFLQTPGTSSSTLYTQAALNPFGLDLAATFPSLSDPSFYLIGFETARETVLAFELVGPLQPVPEPSTMLLVGAGLLAAYGLRRRLSCKK